MAPGGGNGAADGAIFDEDNEQSKPLLGEGYERDGEGSGPVLPSKKLAEYLPLPLEKLSMVHRLLRGLYGHLPREDVPRILWVSLLELPAPCFVEVVQHTCSENCCFTHRNVLSKQTCSSRYSATSTRPRASTCFVSRCPREPTRNLASDLV